MVSGGTVKAVLEIKNLKNEVLKDVDLKVALCKDLGEDISVSDELKDRVKYENSTVDKEENKIVNFKISTINENETIEIDLNPYTDEELNGKDNLDVWMLVEATTKNDNSYLSNKLTRNVKKVGIDVTISQKCQKEDGSNIDTSTAKLNNGDLVRFVTTITNNSSKDSSYEFEYNVDKKIDIKSAKIKTTSSQKDVLNDIYYNDMNEAEQAIKAGETLTVEMQEKEITIERKNIAQIKTVYNW